MKLFLTGHTSGIGAAIFRKAANGLFNFVYAYSRSNGYDISKQVARDEIIFRLKEEKEPAVFINNANAREAEMDLFFRAFDFWRYDKTKRIICMGSTSTDVLNQNYKITGYASYKAGLHHAVRHSQLSDHLCRVTLFRMSFVDTPMVAGMLDKNIHSYLTPEQVAEQIFSVINSPIYIREMVIAGVKNDARP